MAKIGKYDIFMDVVLHVLHVLVRKINSFTGPMIVGCMQPFVGKQCTAALYRNYNCWVYAAKLIRADATIRFQSKDGETMLGTGNLQISYAHRRKLCAPCT